MGNKPKIVGGTQGAQDAQPETFIRFDYSDRDWQTIAALVGGDGWRDRLEWLASEHLQLPSHASAIEDHQEQAAWLRRVSEQAAQLLQILEEDGRYSVDEDFVPNGSDVYSKLHGLANLSDLAHDMGRAPSRNSHWQWGNYLRKLCEFWDRTLACPVTTGRDLTGQASSPLIDFLVAAAGPVKGRRGPENLTGPMTAEMAYHAVARYQKELRDDRVESDATIEKILASEESGRSS